MSRARRPEQVSLGLVDIKYEPETFDKNINSLKNFRTFKIWLKEKLESSLKYRES